MKLGKLLLLSAAALLLNFPESALKAEQADRAPVAGIVEDQSDTRAFDGDVPLQFMKRRDPEIIPPGNFPDEVDCEVDLENNRIGNRNPQAIKAFYGPCDSQAVIQLTLDPKTTEKVRARVELLYGYDVKYWTFNIADSVSNNGYGGDSGHQSRDGEAQILDGNLTVYGDDFMEADPEKGKVLGSTGNLATSDSTVIFDIRNNRLDWQNDRSIDGSVISPHIFSLGGQEDKEGPVNYDIYLGLNRVVNGDRTGKGLKRVRIRLFSDAKD